MSDPTDPFGYASVLAAGTLDALSRRFGLPVALDRNPTTPAQAERYADELASQGCSLVIGAGPGTASAISRAAARHPGTHFAVIGGAVAAPPPNLFAVTFAVQQPAFLAGYLAAEQTETGNVGTFVAGDVRPFRAALRGFAAGILAYDRDVGASVRLLGFDPSTGVARVSGPPSDVDSAYRTAIDLIAHGAGVLLPLAFQAGLGVGRAVSAVGDVPLVGFGVDAVGKTLPRFDGLWLTSIEVHVAAAVTAVVLEVARGTFHGGNHLETLANGGVALAPFHHYDRTVDFATRHRLEVLTAGIEAGTVPVDPSAYPQPSPSA